MKAVSRIKLMSCVALVAGLAAQPVLADKSRHDHRFESGRVLVDFKTSNYNNRWHSDDRRYHSERHYRGDRRSDKRFYAGKNLRLDIPVHVRGTKRVKLGRLLNRYYDIDLDHYRLKKVVVNNFSRRHAVANLRTGGYYTGDVYLNDGRTQIFAPSDASRRWMMYFRNARVDNIRVVLEPRYRHAGRYERHHKRWH